LSTDVQEVWALVGQNVSKGEKLLRLDDLDVKLTLTQREAELTEIEAQIQSENTRYQTDRAALEQETKLLALAQSALERAERLAQTQVGSQANVDDAHQAVTRQQLSLISRRRAITDHPSRLTQLQARRLRAAALRDQVLRNLERTRIVAPFDGRITAVHVSPGDRVHPGDRLVDVFDIAYTEIRAQVPNRHLPVIRQSLHEGTPITATATLDGASIKLTLTRLSGKIEAGEGGVDAFFDFQGERPPLELGRTIPVLVSLPAQPGVFALPATAVYGADTVYHINNDRLIRVSVEHVGEYRNGEWGSWSLFRSTVLQDGDIVLTSQLPNAVEGLKIEIISTRD
jgi:multidrug efflux pump subunit AcrA (membrane-fusion protein)